MTHALQTEPGRIAQETSYSEPKSAQTVFRERFKESLLSCIQHDFAVAECFGTIWLETLEEVEIPEGEQRMLYEELLEWAKTWRQ